MKHLEKITIDPDTGEHICHCCGRVVHTEREVMQPPKAGEPLENLKRNHHNTTTQNMHDNGLHTLLDSNRDYSGKAIPSGHNLYNLRKWQQRITTSSNMERRLYSSLVRHNEILAYLVIPKSIGETSITILRKVVKKGAMAGCSYSYLSAAVIYWAYKQHGIANNAKTMLQRLRLKSTAFNKYCMEIDELLGLRDTDNARDAIMIAANKIAKDLSLPSKILFGSYTMLGIARKVIPSDIAGKSPFGIAASLLCASLWHYFGKSNKHATLEDIANAAGVTTVTVRNNYMMLGPVLEKFEAIDEFKDSIRKFQTRRYI